MAGSAMQSFIEILEKQGELIRIKEYVNPDLEITEITDRVSKQPGGGKALLFENTGTDFPLLINSMGSEKRIAIAFGRDSVFDIEKEIENLFVDLMQPKENLWDKLKMLPRLKQMSEWMPRKIKGRGICQEVVMDEPDITKLPVLKCWPADGGKFITLPGVHTVDPETGIPNLGMYRMQLFDKKSTGMHWHRHKTGANHYVKYKKAGAKMPVTVTLGGDPVYTYAATAPMPENFDEYMLAGFLRKRPVKLVKCLTNDLYVPEDADFVIEGYVDTTEEFAWEGPFGDHTGFYSLADWYPKFHITCITHKKNAVYPATVVGVPPMEDVYLGLATERIFLTPIRMSMVPEMKDMTLPVAGVAHNFTVVSIDKSYPGQAIKVMHSLWGAGQMMFNKVLVVVDSDVDIHDNESLIKSFTENFDAGYSIHFSKGPMDVLDHSSQKFAFGSKLGIDLTKPFAEEKDDKKSEYRTESESEISGLKNIQAVSGFKDLSAELSIPVLLLNVVKKEDFDMGKVKAGLQKTEGIQKFKMIFVFNEGADLTDFFMLIWLVGGNLDPERDISVIGFNNGGETVLVDATFKTQRHDNFERDWPNIVTMNDKTISDIDARWNSMGLGEFIKSPSLKFKQLVTGESAVWQAN